MRRDRARDKKVAHGYSSELRKQQSKAHLVQHLEAAQTRQCSSIGRSRKVKMTSPAIEMLRARGCVRVGPID